MVGLFLQTTEGFAADDLPTLHAWVRQDADQGPNLYSIARFNGRWIAGGQDGALMTSTDGFSWSETQIGIPGDVFEIYQAGSAIFLKNPGYCENEPCVKRTFRSEDGVSWTPANELPAELAPVADLPRPYRPSAPPVRAGDRWLVIAHVSSVNTGAIFASDDGQVWTRVLINAFEFDSIAGRDGLYLASDIKGQIHLSNDLQTWTSGSLPGDHKAASVLVGAGFVLAGARDSRSETGGVYASADGLEWDLLSITGDPIYGGAVIDGAFWFVGQRGLIVEIDPRKPAPLVNLSARTASDQADSSHIVGFVVEGEGPRQILVRAIGPGLAEFGVGDGMSTPKLEVWSGGNLIESAGAWSLQVNAEAIRVAADQAGAFALDPKGEDAALLLTLVPGAYTALAHGEVDSSGQRLIEVYDVTEPGAHLSSLSNSSDRGQISATNPMVGGFVVRGDRDRLVLIRAIGPGLGGFDVAETAADPSITIWQNGEIVAQNGDWGESANGPSVRDAALTVGAFGLADDSKDAALVFQARPGAYTVHVSCAEGTEGGEALLEVYHLDQ